jgi:hypothetical protein
LLEWLLSRTQTTTNVGENVGKRNPHTLLVGMKISITSMENSMEAPQKTENKAVI